MIGWVIKDKNVYHTEFEECNVDDSGEFEQISINMVGNFYWSYRLYRNPKDAFIDLKSEINDEYNKIISQKEDLEKKLNEIEQTLKEIENDI